MRAFRLLALGAVCAGMAACSRDTDGEIVAHDPVGGLRYVNLVSNAGALDFRIVDIVGDAPNSVGAAFRSGGLPYGANNPIPTQPPHLQVRAGTRNIRVFLSGTVDTISSFVVMDTTVTFEANTNYTFFLHGTSAAPQLLVSKDSVPTIPAGNFALRVINLAATMSSAVNQPANINTPVDVAVSNITAASPGATPQFTNLPFGTISPYVNVPVTVAATPLMKLVGLASGTTSPNLFVGTLPTGVATVANVSNGIAGTLAAGSAITAVIVPRSTPASPAPQTVPTNVTTGIDSITRAADVVTVWRAMTPGNGTSTCATAVAAGVAAGDVLAVTGLTAPEYNGQFVVGSVTAGVNQTVGTPFACTGGSPSRFTYRIVGTPVSPAAGTRQFRIIGSGANRALDYSVPGVIYLIDREPDRTII